MKILIIILLFLFAQICNAADWYVSKDGNATNSGTNWNTAWNEMEHIGWAGLSPGDTVWVAGGTYLTPMKPAKSGTALARIYVKRVRTTDTVPIASAGWNASFDSQVVVSGVAGDSYQALLWNSGTDQRGSYITIDGRVDSGIKFYTLSSGGNVAMMDTGNTGVTLQYIDFAGPGGSTPYEYTGDSSALYLITGSGRGEQIKDITVRYCRLHGTVNLIKLNANNPIFEYNRFYDNTASNPETYHTNVISSAAITGIAIFRYNDVYNWDSEGIMPWSSTQIWKVYSNIFHDMVPESVARVVEATHTEHTLYFYGNTIVNTWGSIRKSDGTFSSSSQIRNNLFWNAPSPSDIVDTDYNFSYTTIGGEHSISNGSDPFTNLAGQDYTIISTIGSTYPRDMGATLDAEYSTDILGTTRSAPWDIGAYEYVNTGPNSLKGGYK